MLSECFTIVDETVSCSSQNGEATFKLVCHCLQLLGLDFKGKKCLSRVLQTGSPDFDQCF